MGRRENTMAEDGKEVVAQARASVREAFAQARDEVKKEDEMSKLEEKVEYAFLKLEDWVSEELVHQKQHLVLMQNQLDQILVSVKKENAALSQQISNEKAQRTLAQRSAREGKEVLSDLLKGLSNRVEALEKPWWKRIFSCDPRHHAK